MGEAGPVCGFASSTADSVPPSVSHPFATRFCCGLWVYYTNRQFVESQLSKMMARYAHWKMGANSPSC